MSPRRILKSCGSSSTFARRSSAPNGKMREALAAVMTLSFGSATGRRFSIVRSLYIVNSRPRRPARIARYRTGPGLDRRIPSAATIRIGTQAISARAVRPMSNRRLTTAHRAANGHEDLGRRQAVLVAPRDRAVAQRIERARMRILAHFALVAAHRRDLAVERRGDLDPGIGDERARIRPLGAARGIEREDGGDAGHRGPRGHERRLEQQLVIAVDVAAPLAVDRVRLDLRDDALERRDDVGQRQRVEPLVGKTERPNVLAAELFRGAPRPPGGSVSSRLSANPSGRMSSTPSSSAARIMCCGWPTPPGP